jgi:hypothetical protein
VCMVNFPTTFREPPWVPIFNGHKLERKWAAESDAVLHRPNWCSTKLPFLIIQFSSVNSSTGPTFALYQPTSSRFRCSPNNLSQVLLKSEWPLLLTADSARTHSTPV